MHVFEVCARVKGFFSYGRKVLCVKAAADCTFKFKLLWEDNPHLIYITIR